MSYSKSKEKKGTIFQSIRKPTAPSSQKFGTGKREDKLDPVQRKAKHKKKKQRFEIDPDV